MGPAGDVVAAVHVPTSSEATGSRLQAPIAANNTKLIVPLRNTVVIISASPTGGRLAGGSSFYAEWADCHPENGFSIALLVATGSQR